VFGEPAVLLVIQAMADYSALLPNIEGIWATVKVYPIDPVSGCQEANYAPCKGKGYMQVRLDGTKYYVHILAAMHQCRRAPGLGEEASHRCHNAACVNPDHLVFETGEPNKSRLCCRLYGTREGYRCPHEGVCVGCVPL
jgi:hypothetical protein